ncbi:MAG: cell division protein FtsZ [Candidatus Nanoarchaeia archaeon]
MAYIPQTIKRERTPSPVDEELEKLLTAKKARIKVVGVGGAGNNTLNRIAEIGIAGIETIAANTDAQDLLATIADKKILLGKELTGGLGAGSNPKIGEDAAKENEADIKEALRDAHLVFVTCGLGGGTGTGAAPVIAEIAKKLGILTVGVVTLPFSVEAHKRFENAMMGLEKLQDFTDTLIVIPNDKLLEIAPDLPLHTAFKVADEILTNAVKGIAELISKPGLINLDFADVKTVMTGGGIAMIGVGESDTENRAIESVEKAIKSPLLDVEISGATGALINVTGGPSMTLAEAKKVVEAVSMKLSEKATVIWGAQIAPELQNSIRALLIVTGVKSAQIFGPQKTLKSKRKEDLANTLGIEFID